jgi:hypothetical protein
MLCVKPHPGIAGMALAGYNPTFAVEQSGRIFQPIFFA